jgi:hypothetical protein
MGLWFQRPCGTMFKVDCSGEKFNNLWYLRTKDGSALAFCMKQHILYYFFESGFKHHNPNPILFLTIMNNSLCGFAPLVWSGEDRGFNPGRFKWNAKITFFAVFLICMQ